jgi:hypothetical protein
LLFRDAKRQAGRRRGKDNSQNPQQQDTHCF